MIRALLYLRLIVRAKQAELSNVLGHMVVQKVLHREAPAQQLSNQRGANVVRHPVRYDRNVALENNQKKESITNALEPL